MDVSTLAHFTHADPDFFDRPDRLDDTGSRFEAPTEIDSADWRRIESNGWTGLFPRSDELAEQGWKVHVAATPANAVKTLDIVWRYCVGRSIGFKFLRSEKMLHLMSDKNCARSRSGKFITVYAGDERRLAAVLTDLEPMLAGFDGPYILGDLRHRNGPLYVRYGAFRELRCADAEGRPVLAVRRPDGTLVPDVRSTAFGLPSWIGLPPVLAADLAARDADVEGEFPYDVESALQFSNGGGVYLARSHATGDRVVVREGRAHAGLDGRGRDAVASLRNARWAMTALAGLGCVPRLIDYCVVGDHEFLVEEYVPGRTLLRAIATGYPSVHPRYSATDREAYVAWVERVCGNIERALAEVHARGVALGDLHPDNVMVRPDDSVVFIDFETATAATDTRGRALGAPGFAPPGVHRLSGADADRYALDCVRLTALLPVPGLLDRDRSKLSTLLTAAAAELPVPAERIRSLRHRLAAGGDPAADRAAALFADVDRNWDTIRADITRAILAGATPERPDRLYPGDPGQFDTDGLDLDSGAAGVLYALHRTGGQVPAEHVDWLERHAATTRRVGDGLYTGLHGVAVVLDLLGRRAPALDLIERLGDGDSGGHDVYRGRAGVALALLYFARRADLPRLRRRAIAIADRLDAAVPAGEPSAVGLMRGASGPAVLFLDLYEETGDPALLDRAAAALRQDLSRCVDSTSGTLYVREGTRYLPYLHDGSLGVATVCARYLRHRRDDEFSSAVAAARRSCHVPFAFQSELRHGRAGLILGLAHLDHPDDRDAIGGHVRRLGWHAVNRRDGIAFPGRQLARLSSDLSTGSSGVLLAVHAATARDGTFLPLLAEQRDPHVRPERR